MSKAYTGKKFLRNAKSIQKYFSKSSGFFAFLLLRVFLQTTLQILLQANIITFVILGENFSPKYIIIFLIKGNGGI